MTERITSPQQKQLSRLLEEVVEALNLSKDAAQRVLGQGGVFKENLTSIIKELAGEKFSSTVHAPDLIPSWGTVIDDVEPTVGLDVEKLEFVSPFKVGEERIAGKEMRSRAKKLGGNLGLSDAKYILANQAKIPVELRGKCIVLPGTVFRNASGDRHILYIGWHDGRWHLHFRQLNYSFASNAYLVRSKQS